MIGGSHDPVRGRIQVLTVVVGVIVLLLFLGATLYLATEGATGDITIGLTGAFAGFTFVFLAWMFLQRPTPGNRISLIMLLSLFLLCWLLSLIVALALWGELDPAGYVGIVLVIVAAVLMGIIVSDAGKMLVMRGTPPPPPPPPPEA